MKEMKETGLDCCNELPLSIVIVHKPPGITCEVQIAINKVVHTEMLANILKKQRNIKQHLAE